MCSPTFYTHGSKALGDDRADLESQLGQRGQSRKRVSVWHQGNPAHSAHTSCSPVPECWANLRLHAAPLTHFLASRRVALTTERGAGLEPQARAPGSTWAPNPGHILPLPSETVENQKGPQSPQLSYLTSVSPTETHSVDVCSQRPRPVSLRGERGEAQTAKTHQRPSCQSGRLTCFLASFNTSCFKVLPTIAMIVAGRLEAAGHTRRAP